MFRKFYEAEVPKAGPFMPNTMQAASNIFAAAQRRQLQQQQAKQNALAQYKADSFASKFNTDQEDLNQLAKSITEHAVTDMMNSPSGTLSPQVRERQARAMGYKNQSDAQWQGFQDIQTAINQTKFETGGKNYYNSQHDAERLMKAAYGDDKERVTWFNRGDRLQDIAKTIGTDMIQSFDKEGYLSDYVEGMKSQVRETKSKSISGVEQGSKIDAVFLNKNGVPQVTDEHAINYLQSSQFVTTRYQQELNQQLLSEANKIRATPQGAWAKDLSDAQVVAELRNNPEKNIINQVAPGIRERNLAKIDLEKKQRQNLTNSYDAGNYDPDAARGITSKFFTVAPSFDRNSFGGSGGKLTSKSGEKTGMMVSLKGQAFDVNEGRMTGNDRSSRDAVIKSYNLAPVLNGVPVNISANTTEEYVKKINEIPLDQIRNMDLKTVIKGQAFNKPEILSNARVERDKLDVKPNKTEEDKGKLEALTKVLDMASINPDLEPEVIQSALKTVLGTVVEDLVKVVEPKDPETVDIQNKLGRYSITDSRNWSSDDKAISEAFNKRKAEAVTANDKAVKEAIPGQAEAMKNSPPEGKNKPSRYPTIANDDDYAKLKPGALFIAPDGKQYRKPGKKKFLDKDGDGVPDSKLDD